MKKYLSLFVVLAMAFGISANFADAAGPTCTVPGDYATIQEAVNDVGCTTINVAAGTYLEQVTVNRSVVINGANAGTPGNLSRVAESIVDGGNTSTPFVITANDVTISGFTVQNGSNGGFFSGIWSQTGTTGSIITDNIITKNGIGVWAQCGGNCMVQNNLFDGNNQPGPSGGAGISADSTNGLTISNNEFKNHTLNNPILFQAAVADAHLNDVISNNNIHDNLNGGSAVYALALNNASFTGNDITADTSDIRLGGGNHTVSITGNTLHSTVGVNVVDDGFGLGLNTGVVVDRNSLTGHTVAGVDNSQPGQTAAVDATCNWWGAANGPGPVGTGSGDPVSANVTFSPWLTTSAIATSPCDGVAAAPVISNVSIHSNNASPSIAKNGDIITLTFTTDQPVTKLGNFKINSSNPDTFTNVGNDYTATHLVDSGDPITGVPVTFQINVKNAAGIFSQTIEATNDGSSVTIVSPVTATLNAEDFGVVTIDAGVLGTVKGYTAGFGLTGATFAGSSVKMELFGGPGGTTLFQTNTSTAKVGTTILGTQISSPFDVSGNFDYAADGFWVNHRETQFGQSVAATRVKATVTLADGTVLTAENTNPTGDPTTIFAPVLTSVKVTPATATISAKEKDDNKGDGKDDKDNSSKDGKDDNNCVKDAKKKDDKGKEVEVCNTVQLTATDFDQFGVMFVGATTTFSSSNPAVATVSATGLVTGVKAGTATITATSVSGNITVSGTSLITVIKEDNEGKKDDGDKGKNNNKGPSANSGKDSTKGKK